MHCYFFSKNKLNWQKAENYCNTKNSSLVRIIINDIENEYFEYDDFMVSINNEKDFIDQNRDLKTSYWVKLRKEAFV